MDRSLSPLEECMVQCQLTACQPRAGAACTGTVSGAGVCGAPTTCDNVVCREMVCAPPFVGAVPARAECRHVIGGWTGGQTWRGDVGGHQPHCPRARAILEYEALADIHHCQKKPRGDSLAVAIANALQFQQLCEALNPFSAQNLSRGYSADPVACLGLGLGAVVLLLGGFAIASSSGSRHRRRLR